MNKIYDYFSITVYSRGNWDKELNVLNRFCDYTSIQLIKMKRTSNGKIKEK